MTAKGGFRRLMEEDRDLDLSDMDSIPTPDMDIIEPSGDDEEEQNQEQNPSSSNFLNAPAIFNMRFAACVEAMDVNDFARSHILSLVKAVSLAIPEKSITDFQEWQDLEEKYGPIMANKKLLLSEEEYHDRFDAVALVAKAVGITGRRAQQGEPAKFLSFESVYPPKGEI